MRRRKPADVGNQELWLETTEIGDLLLDPIAGVRDEALHAGGREIDELGVVDSK
jgi:hypothetical protein